MFDALLSAKVTGVTVQMKNRLPMDLNSAQLQPDTLGDALFLRGHQQIAKLFNRKFQPATRRKILATNPTVN